MSTDARIAMWGCIVNSSVWGASAQQPYGFMVAAVWIVVAFAIQASERKGEQA
jgi:hypothetical protein